MEDWTTPQTALPASLITNQFDFYHASTEVVIVNEQRFSWRWFIEFHLKTPWTWSVFALVGLLTPDFITPGFPLAAVTEFLYNTFVMAQNQKKI